MTAWFQHLTFSQALALLTVVALLSVSGYYLGVRPAKRANKRRMRRAGAFISNTHIDRARVVGNFHVTSAMVDKKGIFRL